MAKRYFWIKLPKDFFQQREIKKLRKIAGGDTYTIIYLKLLLLAADTGGMIEYEVDQDFVEELSLDIDEDTENVRVCVNFLLINKLMIEVRDGVHQLTQASKMVGSESESAERVRQYRQKTKMLHCNEIVTSGLNNVTIEKEKEKRRDIRDKSSGSSSNRVEAGTARPSAYSDSGAGMTTPLEYWDNNYSPLTSGISEQLNDLIAEHGNERVLYALKEGVNAGVHTIRYIRAICEADAAGTSKRCQKTKRMAASSGDDELDRILAERGIDV